MSRSTEFLGDQGSTDYLPWDFARSIGGLFKQTPLSDNVKFQGFENVPWDFLEAFGKQYFTDPKGGFGVGASFGAGGSNPHSLPSTLGSGKGGTAAILKNPNLWKALLASGVLSGSGNLDLSKVSFGADGMPQSRGNFPQGNSPNGGGRGGGGGGGGKFNINDTIASSFVNDLLQNINFGELNPEFLDNIDFLQKEQLGNFSSFNSTINGLAALYADKLGGDDFNSILSAMGGVGVGGGGVYNPNTSIKALLAQLPEFKARDIRTGLPELDPRIAKELGTITDSQLADFEASRRDTLSDITTDLFGRGVQRSTVAGEAFNRGLESLDRTKLAILSEDAKRKIGVRESEAARILEGDLSKLGAEAATFGDRLRALTGIKTSEIGAAATTSAAASSAAASLAGSRLSALSSLFSNRMRGLTDIFGTQAGALSSGFGNQTGGISNFADLFANLAATEAGQDIEKHLGLGNIALGRIGEYNSEEANRIRDRGIGLQANIDRLRLQEAINSRLQSGMLTREEFDLRRELARLGANTDMQLASRNDTSTWERLLTVLALGAGSYFGGN